MLSNDLILYKAAVSITNNGKCLLSMVVDCPDTAGDCLSLSLPRKNVVSRDQARLRMWEKFFSDFRRKFLPNFHPCLYILYI